MSLTFRDLRIFTSVVTRRLIVSGSIQVSDEGFRPHQHGTEGRRCNISILTDGQTTGQRILGERGPSDDFRNHSTYTSLLNSSVEFPSVSPSSVFTYYIIESVCVDRELSIHVRRVRQGTPTTWTDPVQVH